MRIGILMAGHVMDEMRPEFGDLDAQFHRLLEGHGFDFTTYAVVDGIFPASPEDHDGWIITGSKFGTYDGHDWIARLEELVRAIYAADRPLVGICFGHQIIAQALGGVNEKFGGGWSLGHQTYLLADGRTRKVMAWHQDQVTSAPEGAACVGSSEFCRNAYLLYGDRAYTMQPHPEFSASFTDGLLHHRRAGLPADLAQQAEDHMTRPLDTAASADEIARFLKTRSLT